MCILTSVIKKVIHILSMKKDEMKPIEFYIFGQECYQ